MGCWVAALLNKPPVTGVQSGVSMTGGCALFPRWKGVKLGVLTGVNTDVSGWSVLKVEKVWGVLVSTPEAQLIVAAVFHHTLGPAALDTFGCLPAARPVPATPFPQSMFMASKVLWILQMGELTSCGLGHTRTGIRERFLPAPGAAPHLPGAPEAMVSVNTSHRGREEATVNPSRGEVGNGDTSRER